VGAGGIFTQWMPFLKTENVDIAAIVDLNVEVAQQRIEEFGIGCKASANLSDTLETMKPDFVIDLTVPEAHCQVTCTALRAGCHVIGEKPMAASMAEARRMVRTSAETGKLYMVSQSRRWSSQHLAAAHAVHGNLVGNLTIVNCDFYIGAHFGGFRAEMESPLILDMAIHHFDLARMISGKDPVAVYAHEFNPRGSWYQKDAAASCIFEMSDGVVFTYRGSWCPEGFQTSWNGDWHLIGEFGSIKMEQDKPPQACQAVKPANQGLIWPREDLPVEQLKVEPASMGGALREMLTFLRTGKQPQTECHDNIKSLAMVFAAMASSRAAKRVLVEPMYVMS